MISGGFIVYAILAVVALAWFITSYHKRVVMVVAFFMMSAFLYGAVNAAYSTKETFNPDLHDCTEWGCPSSFSVLRLSMMSTDYDGRISECKYGWWKEEVITPLVTNSSCVSWQPKEKVNVVEINGTNYSVTERKISELYCNDNPSSESCECTKYANSQHSINYTFGIDEIQTIQNLYLEVIFSENFPQIHPKEHLIIKIERLDNQNVAEYKLPEQGADIFGGERSSTCLNKYEDCQVTEYDGASGKAIRMRCVQKTEYTCKSLKTKITLSGSTCVEAVPR